jgi:protein tyrosine/serine phosphatase
MVQDAATILPYRGAISWFFFFLVVTQLEAFVVPSTPSSCRLLLPSLLNAVSLVTGDSCSVNSVKNLRPVVPGSTLYRSATLDELTEEDAERLLSGSAFDINDEDSKTRKPLASVIDLRNADEISKGEKVRTKGSQFFYDSPDVEFLTIPVLGNVDAFWEEAIATMDAKERMMATLQTVVSGGALDRAAARHLERGGLPLLYAIMMKTGGRPLASALEACMTDSGSVIFHCQKGKDRTGVLAMLLQTCLQSNSIDDNDAEIVDAYALSGELLGELPNQSKDSDDSSSSTSIIDWSYFRGSPAEAMTDTLAWTRQQYGSVEGYLDSISFGEEKRVRLRGYNQK